jgi:hypothetical protein
MSIGDSTESNIRSSEAFVMIYLSITMISYTKYLIIELSLLKKASKKRNYEIINQYLTNPLCCNTSRLCAWMSDVKIRNYKMAIQC